MHELSSMLSVTVQRGNAEMYRRSGLVSSMLLVVSPITLV